MKSVPVVVFALLVMSLWGLGLPTSVASNGSEPELPILYAEAGPNQTVTEGDLVVFDGSSSYVVNGTLDEYYWDFDAAEDSDLDGNFTNDRDATGAVVTHRFGDDGDYGVTLTIGSEVEGVNESLIAQDTVLIIDSSGSMGWNDPEELRQQAAEDYLYLMSDNDYATVVVFGKYPRQPGPPSCSSAAWLVYDTHLVKTDAYGKPTVKNSIDYTRFDSGGTNIEKALQVAHQELLPGYKPTPTELPDCSPAFPAPGGHGKDNHAWIEILLTDGEPSHSTAATSDEVRIAAYAGIKIFTIGLGTNISEDYLQEMAYKTGGRYYFAPSADDLEEIYTNISKIIKTIIGGTIYASDGLIVHVQNEAPQVSFQASEEAEEGSTVDFWANVTDPGSDDIHLLFEWGDGSDNETAEYLNDPPDPDPYPSPDINPRDISEQRTHIFGDDWNYTVTVTVWDDDGGITTGSLVSVTGNVPPALTLSIPSSTVEGDLLAMSASATDDGSDDLKFTWTFGDGTSENATYYNDGSEPDPAPSPWGTFPFSASDPRTHTWGDDGIYDLTVMVEDDDGGWSSSTVSVTVANLPPEILIPTDLSFDEGEPFALSASATDPGSDDLEFVWDIELAPSRSAVYYNDGIGPDPAQSPLGTYPFSATDTLTREFGDNGLYNVDLTVTDDDGGAATVSFQIEIKNVSPLVDSGGPYIAKENSEIDFQALVSDPGSDDIYLTWDWGDGTSDSATFLNAGWLKDQPKSPWGTHPFNVTHATSHLWGDNGYFDITLTAMDDDGGITVSQIVVVVSNVDPTIIDVSYDVYFNLPRTQGYWNFQCVGKLPSPDHVGIRQEYVDYISSNSLVYSGISTKEEVCDYLGNVDESDMTQKALQQLMALWLNIASEKVKIQSEMFIPQLNVTMILWDFMTWIEDVVLNHVDQMELAKDLADETNNGHLLPFAVVTANATARDPGSDDLIFTWAWGDGSPTEHVHYNDGMGPDPYPSPEVSPMLATDAASHSYSSPGTYVIRLTVSDDDGGFTFVLIPITASIPHAIDLPWIAPSPLPGCTLRIEPHISPGIQIHTFEVTV